LIEQTGDWMQLSSSLRPGQATAEPKTK